MFKTITPKPSHFVFSPKRCRLTRRAFAVVSSYFKLSLIVAISVLFLSACEAAVLSTSEETGPESLVVHVPAIGDRVWLDYDGDGVQDGGEPGAAGVTLDLTRYGCNWLGTDCGWWLADTTLTASDGSYSFAGLDPTKSYMVRVKSAPFSYTYSPANATDDAHDSDVIYTTSVWGSESVKLSDKEAAQDWDIGLVTPLLTVSLAPTSTPIGVELQAPEPPIEPIVLVPEAPGLLVRVPALGDRVWLDSDGDGIQDDGELGAAGVTLQIFGYRCSFFGTDCGFWLDDTTVTGSDGSYSFVGLIPSRSYIVRVQSAPFTFEYSPPDATDDEQDSDVQASGGTIGPIWTGETVKPSESGADHKWDIGLVVPLPTLTLAPSATPAGIELSPPETVEPVVPVPDIPGPVVRVPAISGRVWFDTNEDGMQDSGEGGAAGVTLEILHNVCSWFGTSCSLWLVDTTITGSDGSYGFVGLDPTYSYYVYASSAPFIFDYSPLNATDDAHDSDVLVASGWFLSDLIKPSAPDATHWDIGLVTPNPPISLATPAGSPSSTSTATPTPTFTPTPTSTNTPRPLPTSTWTPKPTRKPTPCGPNGCYP